MLDRRLRYTVKMSLWVGLPFLAVLLFIGFVRADPTQKLMGLSEEELISCAGIPAAQMTNGQKTFYQYNELSERGTGIMIDEDTIISSKKQKGCQALITIESGRVSKVMLKKQGWLSGSRACERIFSECPH